MPYLFTNILALQVKPFTFHNNNINYFFSHSYHFEYQKNIFIVNKKNATSTISREKKENFSKQISKFRELKRNDFCNFFLREYNIFFAYEFFTLLLLNFLDR